MGNGIENLERTEMQQLQGNELIDCLIYHQNAKE
jgi:hypothetical protein